MSTFFGWIPNVTGRLSFSLSGTSAYPTKFNHITNIRSGGRRFVGYQRRNLSDTSVPFLTDWPWLKAYADKWVFNKDGRFTFFCILRVTDDYNAAEGNVYALTSDSWDKYQKSIDAKLLELDMASAENYTIADTFGIAEADLVYGGHFSISRNGTTTLKTDNIIAENKWDIGEARLEHALAAQSYFCLRDLLHTHRFHSPSTDTIVDVYPTLAEYHQQVNYGLMRRILSVRRVETVEAQNRALGILTYLSSFRENVMPKSERAKLPFSIETTRRSIEAAIPIISQKEFDRPVRILDRLRSKVIVGSSLLFGYAALIEESKVLVPDSLSWVAASFDFIQKEVGIAFVLLVLALQFIQWTFASTGKHRDHILQTTSRLALAYPFRRFAIFEIVLGVVFAAASFSAVGWAVHKMLSLPAV